MTRTRTREQQNRVSMYLARQERLAKEQAKKVQEDVQKAEDIIKQREKEKKKAEKEIKEQFTVKPLTREQLGYITRQQKIQRQLAIKKFKGQEKAVIKEFIKPFEMETTEIKRGVAEVKGQLKSFYKGLAAQARAEKHELKFKGFFERQLLKKPSPTQLKPFKVQTGPKTFVRKGFLKGGNLFFKDFK